MTSKDLSKSSTQAIALDGVAHTLGNGKAQTRMSGALTPDEKKLEKPCGDAKTGCVALLEFPSLSKAVAAGELLPSDRAYAHTERRLRPLRRRAERTARPERVRIRTRNPWVRLRRRLLGW